MQIIGLCCNLEEELYKMIQQTALYDYREDHALESLLPREEKYVSRIRFSDRDNLSANLTGENGVDCIYDAKTFMCIRDSYFGWQILFGNGISADMGAV